MNGGRFDFDDGGTYCGGWEEGKAHGHGVCTGPQGKGEYAGAWHYGFEVSGVYTWPSGNTYQGQWQNGKRHGLGVEQRGRWIYKGEWTQGYKGRYGVRQSNTSNARYQGTWSAGFHDGYGTEIYVDSGTYQGQWLRGMRHGYGVRKSAQFATAAKFRSKSHTNASLTSLRSGRGEQDNETNEAKERVDGRGGFVLKANSAAPARRRRSLSERSLAVKRTILSGLRIKKQHSTGDIHQRVTSMTGSLRSSGSTMSCTSEDSLHRGRGEFTSPEEEAIEDTVTEAYSGEWKNDSRSGFGVCERSDGLKYYGEWANNAKNGYGVTTFRDGTKEEGKYKNNVLVVSSRRKGMLFVRSSKLRERVEASVEAANRAASIAQQKADIAASRTSTAKERSEQAFFVATQAKEDSDMARIHAKQFDPNFKQPGTDMLRRHLHDAHLGESFDMMDQPGSRMQSSGAHSKQQSFEQQSSFEMPAEVYSNHVGYSNHQMNHDQQQPQQQPQQMHVNFDPQIQYHKQYSHSSMSSAGNPQMASTSAQIGMGLNPGMSGMGIHDPVMVQSSMQAPPPVQVEEPSPPLEDKEEFNEIMMNHVQPSSAASSNLMTSSHSQHSSSRFSLSDDHYDQYVMAGNPQQSKIKRNRPSLTRQPGNVYENNPNTLNRRSTLASARDRKTDSSPELMENMGSLPNLAQLEGTGLRLRREDAARLASQRRQEVLRDNEEQALLRANPLRYLFHPAFRVWLVKWKIPLILAAANMSLLLLFYNLLTYEKKKNAR